MSRVYYAIAVSQKDGQWEIEWYEYDGNHWKYNSRSLARDTAEKLASMPMEDVARKLWEWDT